MKTIKAIPLISALGLSLLALEGCKTTQSSSQPSIPAPPSSSPSSSSSSSSSSGSSGGATSQSGPTSPGASRQGGDMPSMPGSSPSGGMPGTPSAGTPGMPSLPSGASLPGTPSSSSGTSSRGTSEAADNGPDGKQRRAGTGNEPVGNRRTAGYEHNPDKGSGEQAAQGVPNNRPGEMGGGEPGSETESDDIDFSEAEAGGGSYDAKPGEPAMTDAERAAELEGELDESMASYDGMILRERGYILNRGNEEGSEEDLEAAGGVPYYEEDFGNEQPGAPGPGGAGQATAGDGNPNTSGGGYRPDSRPARAGDYQHDNQTAPPPPDIPSGEDDDVVARQIREAAMREQDPALREKLWEEYRKYKNQSKQE